MNIVYLLRYIIVYFDFLILFKIYSLINVFIFLLKNYIIIFYLLYFFIVLELFL